MQYRPSATGVWCSAVSASSSKFARWNWDAAMANGLKSWTGLNPERNTRRPTASCSKPISAKPARATITDEDIMLEKLLRFSIRQRWLVMVAVLGMAALGFYNYQRLPIDAVPDITNVQVQINTEAP